MGETEKRMVKKDPPKRPRRPNKIDDHLKVLPDDADPLTEWRAAFERANLSTEAVAKLLHITARTVRRYNTGETVPPLAMTELLIVKCDGREVSP